MWKFLYVSVNFFWLKISQYDNIYLLSYVFIKILFKDLRKFSLKYDKKFALWKNGLM